MPTKTDGQPETQPEDQQLMTDASFDEMVRNEGGYDAYYDQQFASMANQNQDFNNDMDAKYGPTGGAPGEEGGGATPPDDLKQAEENPGNPAAAGNWDSKEFAKTQPEENSPYKYDPNSGETRGQHFKRTVLNTRDPKNRRRLITGGVFGGITGIVLSLFTLILPMKLEATMQNLKQYYFANTESVIAQRTSYLVHSYLATSLAQSDPTNKCGAINIVDKDCYAGTANTPVGKLYQQWRMQRFEEKLDTKYGITMRKETNNKRILSVRGIEIDYDDFISEGGSSEASVNRNNYRRVFRQATNEAMDGEAYYKRVYYRWKLGKYIYRDKLGGATCVTKCGPIAKGRAFARELKRDAQKYSVNKFAQSAVSQRVLGMRADIAGLVFGCILDVGSGACDTDPKVDTSDQQGVLGRSENRRSALEREITSYAQRAGTEITEETLQAAAKVLEDINRSGGYTRYIANTIGRKIGSVFGEAGAEMGEKFAVKAVPVVGWITFAADLISQSAKIGTLLRYANYASHAATAVQMYTTWQSYADEVKLGHGDPDITASMAGALSNGIADVPSSQTAEMSPIWQDIQGSSATSTVSLGGIFSSKAFAATESQETHYTCDDGTRPANGAKICPEEEFIADGALVAYSKFWESAPQSYLYTVANGVSTAAGFVSGIVGSVASALTSLPGVSSALGFVTEKITEVAEPLIDFISSKLISSAANDSMSGARVYQLAAAGASVSASEANINTLGLAGVTPEVAAAHQQEALDEQHSDFASKPLSHRLFATNDRSSLLNKVAVSAPVNRSTIASNSIASIFTNPFGRLSSVFTGIFTPRHAIAAATTNPWGIPQATMSANDSRLAINPALLTPEFCAQTKKAWNDSFKEDLRTGQWVPTIDNPCLRDETVLQIAGGWGDPSLLADSSTPTTPSTPTTSPGDVALAPATNGGPVERSATSEIPDSGGYRIRTDLLPQFMRMIEAAKADGITLLPLSSGWRDPQQQIALRKKNCPDWQNSPSSACKPPTARPGTSNHEGGQAVDFSSMCYKPGVVPSCKGNARWEWLTANAGTYGFKQLKSEAWHWSTTGN